MINKHLKIKILIISKEYNLEYKRLDAYDSLLWTVPSEKCMSTNR